MEKIKFNYVRILYVCFAIVILQNIIFQIVWPSSYSSVVKILIKEVLTIIFIYLFVILYDKLKRGIYFSQAAAIINVNNNLHINWDDLVVDRNGFTPKLMSLRVIILKSKTNKEVKASLELNWFNEQSAISVLKKYAPKGNELHKLIDEYLEIRKIDI